MPSLAWYSGCAAAVSPREMAWRRGRRGQQLVHRFVRRAEASDATLVGSSTADWAELLSGFSAYLRPGFAFGGSCLPKDLRALTHTARRNDVDIPLLANLLTSNETHLRRVAGMVISSRRRRIGICGPSFNPGTADLRESTLVELAERLIGMGFDARIYDATVVLSRLIGANRSYIREQLPHLGDLLTDDVNDVVVHGEVLIAGSRVPEVVDGIDRAGSDKLIVDLVRLLNAAELGGSRNYQGLGW